MSMTTNYKGAGVTQRILDESTANCVKPDQRGPSTPEHIKKYRKSYKMQPGVTIQHYGRVGDPLPNEKHSYGVKTLDSDHVDGVIKQKRENFQDVVTDMKEGKYASAKREPLGKGMSRDYVYPNAINNNDQFRYGNSTIASEYTAKEVIFPPTDGEDTADSKNLYVRSHGAYDAGEQKRRGYNWQVDPENHRFGLKPKEDLKNAAKMCLQPETKDNVFPNTTIVKKNVEDHRNFQVDPLGRSKNLGQTNPRIDPNVPAGKVGGGDEWSAGQCIRGQATIAEMTRNDFIGTATKFGYRNQPKEGDDKRVFGVPTLRTDVKKPGAKSIADPNNYGDEPMAVELLFPQKFAELGISKEDFQRLRTKHEIRQIFESIGIRYKPGKFEGIFLRARQMCGAEFEEASAEAFLNAVVEMHHLE